MSAIAIQQWGPVRWPRERSHTLARRASYRIMNERTDTLELLRAHTTGTAPVDALFDQLYVELKTIARHRLRQLRPGDTLNTTALVHEAYLKLVDQARAQPNDRTHFLALASRAMRYVLVDHARARNADKRGGGQRAVTLERIDIADERANEFLQLNEAVQRLAELDPRLAEVVEYRFFGGLGHEEIASVTGRSVPTVKRDWTRARTWLYRELQARDG
jgi:RNA polymerase sigma factor (TIGR02999 family)